MFLGQFASLNQVPFMYCFSVLWLLFFFLREKRSSITEHSQHCEVPVEKVYEGLNVHLSMII